MGSKFDVIDVKLDKPIREALLRSYKELLPAEICDDKYANWILGFNDLKKLEEKTYSGGELHNNNSSDSELLKTFISTVLQPKLEFYFASLFYIGRIWKVSELSIEKVKNALKEQNLVKTIEENEEALNLGEFLSQDENVYLKLQSILLGALKLHSENLSTSSAWWDNWRYEVAVLFVLEHELGDIEHSEYKTITSKVIEKALEPSILFSKMKDAGIELKGALREVSPDVSSRHIELVRKYGIDNPFSQYFGPLKDPPSYSLFQLVEEHMLPNGSMSFYFMDWYNILVRGGILNVPTIVGEIGFSKYRIESLALSADCAIKQAFVAAKLTSKENERKDDITEYIQELFERFWVHYLLYTAVRDNKNRREELHTPLLKAIELAVIRLNSLGYELQTPPTDKLIESWKVANEYDFRTDRLKITRDYFNTHNPLQVMDKVKRQYLLEDELKLGKALEADPLNVPLWKEEGKILSRLGKYEEALECYDIALELNPNDASIWSDKGYILYNLGKHEQALKSFDKALELDPYDAEVLHYKGQALLYLQRYDEATIFFDISLEMGSRMGHGSEDSWKYRDLAENSWQFKGLALFYLHRYKEAIECLHTAIAMQYNPVPTLELKAWMLASLDENIEALKIIKTVLAEDPDYIWALDTKGFILYNLKRYQEAITAYDKALSIDPYNRFILEHKALAIEKLGVEH